MPLPLAPDAVRRWFPALATGFAYLENAGGSQVPQVVADAICDYMLTSYVQLGAGYAASIRATETVAEAHRFIETLVNAGDAGKVILGPSTTALMHILSHAYAPTIKPGDEIVVAEANHEANAGPWVNLERQGAVIKFWKVHPETCELNPDELKEFVTQKTRFIALPHVSNLLGMVQDLTPVVEIAKSVGAKTIVDGVAYAPHRAIDVQKWGVDYYVYSTYKVYGPHAAALFVRHDAIEEVTGPNHFFIAKDELPYKFQLGGVSHEVCAGLLALRPYLQFLASRSTDDRETITQAFSQMQSLELAPHRFLLDYLKSKRDVRLVGNYGPDCVPTVSFVHARLRSDKICEVVDQAQIGIRFGHMYAVRLLNSLKIPLEPGVVRVSLVHYNTIEEVERLISVLESVL